MYAPSLMLQLKYFLVLQKVKENRSIVSNENALQTILIRFHHVIVLTYAVIEDIAILVQNECSNALHIFVYQLLVKTDQNSCESEKCCTLNSQLFMRKTVSIFSLVMIKNLFMLVLHTRSFPGHPRYRIVSRHRSEVRILVRILSIHWSYHLLLTLNRGQ